MAGLEETLAGVPGLPQFYAAREISRKQNIQDQFDAERAALGPNPTAEQLIGVARKYTSPVETVHYGEASLDRKEAVAARLQMAHELAQYRLDDLARRREADIARVRNEESRQAIDKAYKDETLRLRQHQNDISEELKRLQLAVQQQNADTQRMRAEQTGNKLDEPLLNFIDKIDATKRMIEQNPEAVGGRGMIGRGMEFLGSLATPGQETPASNLQSQILDLQTTYRGLPGHAQSRLKIDAANIDKAIKGLGTFTTADQAIGSLNTLREGVVNSLQRRGVEAPAGVPGAIPGASPQPAPPAAQRQPNTIYLTPRGPLKWTGTGWVPAQ